MKKVKDPEVLTFDTLEVANKKLEATPNHVQWSKGPPVRKYLQFEEAEKAERREKELEQA